ncbi:hydroxymethylbilane synthase, partial [Methanococcoides sp. SA1]|nr:hydroxymethylbilane synthase [Methanococcoides sp. SA1]
RDLDIRLEIINTKGDKILDSALSKIGDKGLFTKELEVALYDGKIDIAVHSLKDLPTALPDGIVLGGVLKREDVRDAFISRDGRKLSEMNDGDVVATSSLRRSSQIRRMNPKLKIIDIRGNIETRIRKMEEGYCDATLLACAGLNRAGYTDKISEALDPEVIIPAVSQGIIGIEVLNSNDEVKSILTDITDREALIMATAERTFLRLLEGGCQVPVACYSRIEGDEFIFIGMVCDLSGRNQIKSIVRGEISTAEKIAEKAANEIIGQGGDKILKEIKELSANG